MSKVPIQDKAESHQDQKAPVTVKVEVVEVFEDTLVVGLHGGNTIGQYIDDMIGTLGLQPSKRLGKLTIDLTEFSQAFITDRTTPL